MPIVVVTTKTAIGTLSCFLARISDMRAVYDASEKCGEAVPACSHSYRYGKGSDGESEGRSPERGAVNAVEGNEIVGEHKEDQDAEAGDCSGGGWEADLTPGETAKGGLGEADGG